MAALFCTTVRVQNLYTGTGLQPLGRFRWKKTKYVFFLASGSMIEMALIELQRVMFNSGRLEETNFNNIFVYHILSYFIIFFCKHLFLSTYTYTYNICICINIIYGLGCSFHVFQPGVFACIYPMHRVWPNVATWPAEAMVRSPARLQILTLRCLKSRIWSLGSIVIHGSKTRWLV